MNIKSFDVGFKKWSTEYIIFNVRNCKGEDKGRRIGIKSEVASKVYFSKYGDLGFLATVIVLSVGVDKLEEEFRKYLERTVYVGIFKNEIEAPLSRRNISSRRDGVVFGSLGLVT